MKKKSKRLKIDLKQIPDRIAVKHLLAEHEIVRLETERKMFTDGVKMICYRAETCLYNLIAPFFARNNDEGSCLFKKCFSATCRYNTGQGRESYERQVSYDVYFPVQIVL